MKTLVLGLGNPILTDDGVGVRVAEAVQQALPPGSAVEVTEASVGGLELMERLLDYESVILIDALHHPAQEVPDGEHPFASPGQNPGTIHRMTLDDLRNISPTQHSASAHDTSLVTALDMAERMGYNPPKEFIIYAVEVENIIDFGETPTPAVAAAIPQVTRAVLADLEVFSRRKK